MSSINIDDRDEDVVFIKEYTLATVSTSWRYTTKNIKDENTTG